MPILLYFICITIPLEVYKSDLSVINTHGITSIGLSQSVPEDHKNVDNSTERKEVRIIY